MTRSEQRTVKSEAVAENGMVTAMHPLAAEAGVEILKRGGNAADAALAAAFAVSVVEPFMSGVGGSAHALAYEARSERTRSFDGSAVAPLGSSEDMFPLSPVEAPRLGVYGFRATDGDAAETGARSITVPGALAAYEKLHQSLGTLSWEEIVAPAIRLAEEGFVVDDYFFVHAAASFSRLRAFPETTRTFFGSDFTARAPSYRPDTPETLLQPALARTLRAISREGARSFYEGPIAESIVSHVRERGGALSLEDLARYQAREPKPIDVTYRGHKVELFPGASGGPTVGLILNLLSGFDLPSLEPDSVPRLHLVAEALRIGFLDRFRFMADPDAEHVPIDGLLSPSYATERRRAISPNGPRATEIPAGDPFRYSKNARGPRRGFGDAASQHTTHVNAADRDGNLVGITATLGARFGSGITVPGTGIVLNNGMMWFDPEPGRLNSIRPGKRALQAGAPSLAYRGDRPLAIVGSPGARKILSAIPQVLVLLLDRELGIQDAIQNPRLHTEADPPLLVESHVPAPAVEGLGRLGHEVLVLREGLLSSYFGRPSGILIDRATGTLRGGVEPYRMSAAVGY
jgi:gamma-glutamyltranspeptidase/glutathione hydrolase